MKSLSEATAILEDQIQSPEVHSDRSVTFRLRSRAAQRVCVWINGQNIDLAVQHGIWSGRTQPLKPGIHDYSLEVDGTRIIDPSNRRVKKWFTLSSMVEVPGAPPLMTELCDVAHGTVRQCYYRSGSVEGIQRPVVVYTPPGYQQQPESDWPLVVLLHGYGNDQTAWTEVGRAHLIADNMIAAGRISPCLIAMPNGHPLPAPYGTRPRNYFADNARLCQLDLQNDLLPWLHSEFGAAIDSQHCFVAGLSMGGGQAIHAALSDLNSFGAIGAFSPATPLMELSELKQLYPVIQGADPAANRLSDFWIPIGRDDFLLERCQTFCDQLAEQGVRHQLELVDGGHDWTVWRRVLQRFLETTVPAGTFSSSCMRS